MLATTIGRYSIKEELGRGRWGIVYSAYDPELDRLVALKYVPLASEIQRERCRREAQSAARLDHPHIVRVYDAGQTAEAIYIVMELLAGGTLRQRLDDPLVWQEGVSLLLPLCDALAYAHEQGIVHRDVKPENILFSNRDEITLVDFGLAYVIGASRLTEDSGMMGTPCYASPEQIRGEPVDGRADVFALAAVLHEALTGQPIFIGTNSQVVYQITQGEPVDLSLLEGIAPRSLLKGLARALAKNPAERYTADEFGAALRHCLNRDTTDTGRILPQIQPYEATQPDIKEELSISVDAPQEDRYTLNYRAAEVQKVMSWIRAGQSGCIIGLRGAGKSNFLRFLLRSDVRRYYLGPDYADSIFVHIDLLALIEQSEWAVYELVLDRLATQLFSLRVDRKIFEQVVSLHREISLCKDSLIARRALERCVSIVCQTLSQRLILLLDEFDAAFQNLDSSLFRHLRVLRDTHKDWLCYLLVTTSELTRLRDEVKTVEHFYRLVSRNVCALGPYKEADARQMIRYLASQRSIRLNTEDTAYLIELSGGHAGLIKATLSILSDVGPDSRLAELAQTLVDEAKIQAECQKIWDNLSQDEQSALRMLVSGAAVATDTLHSLRNKGLIQEDLSTPSLFSPLFASFISRQAPCSQGGLVVDRSLGTAVIDGRRIELTELEFEMLCYLYEHQGQVCTKDELIENVYRQQYDRTAGSIDDARLQTLISRLRAKIESPRYIVTVRGEGYKFVELGER